MVKVFSATAEIAYFKAFECRVVEDFFAFSKENTTSSAVTGEPSEASLKRRNYMLYVGGIAGCGWDYMEIASCTNSGNIEVEHYGLYDGDDRWRSGIGGICAFGLHNNAGTYANYCKMEYHCDW